MKRCRLSVGILLSVLVLSGCAGGQIGASAPATSVSEESASETIIIETLASSELTSEEMVLETTTEDVVKIPDEYYEVIDSIVSCIDNFDSSGINTYFGNEYGGGVCELCSYDEPKSLVGYAFTDIDGDRVAELLILDISSSEYENRIIELYTYADGEVKHLLSGGFRARIYLSTDMILYIEGSSGAFYSSVDRYELDDTHEAVFIDSYYTLPVDIGGDNEGIRICYTTDKGSIFSEDFDSGFAEEIETITGSSDIYKKYGVKSVGLYVYDEVTTLDDYSR